MEPSDLEKQLSELEEKIDRLRALYEQYFMGIERLEPLTPRKDVDRKIVLLRKEQMRNTALRFRFNTLCQRFNTMQQHWGRITREIENGTYKRDVARAAARFGLDDALTAVGRKRAASLQKVLEKQGIGEDQKRREEEKRKEEQARAAQAGLDDDDDAPTPPPPPGGLRPTHFDSSKFAPPPADPAALASYGFGPPPGFAPPPTAAAADAALAALGFPSGPAAPGARPAPPPAAAPPPARPGPPPLPQRPRTQADPLAPVSSPAPSAPAAHAPEPHPAADAAQDPSAPKKAPGGLRLGGGGRRAADPDAARRRLEELAEKMGASVEPSAATPAPPPARRFAPEDIAASVIPASVPPPAASPQRPAAAPALRPLTGGVSVSPDKLAPPASKPLGLRPPTIGRGSSPSLEGDAGGPVTPPPRAAAQLVETRQVPATPLTATTPIAPHVAASAAAASTGPTAAERAEALRADNARAAARREDGIGESRVREIYKELIEAKRKANESTASITFDKLQDSLRKQVDKLKKEHTDRRIDFTVVTKDGKAMIKPIIK